VDRWQASLGESQTGKIPLGQIVFLPGAQRVTQLETTCGSTGGGSGNSGTTTGPSNGCGSPETSVAPAWAPELVDFTSNGTTTPNGTTPSNPGSKSKPGHRSKLKTLEQEIAQLKAEIAHMKAGSGKPSSGSGKPSSGSGKPSSGSGKPSSGSGKPSSGSGSHSPGNGGGSASAILQTTSTELVVTVDLDASKQSEAKVGEPVTVEMPAGNTVNGTITDVSPVAQSSNNNNNGNNNGNGNGNGNNSSGSTIPLTITLSRHQSGAGLDQASVSVNFSQARANDVLSVPVTALLATGGGRYAVQEAAAPHQLIPVTTGLFAAGYVQISGSGIHPGLEVTDSQG
jgi:hypothetical protein